MLNSPIIRFAIVGVINTLVDVSLFLFLRHLEFSVVLANICSTSAGLVVSFLLNRSYVFAARSEKYHRQFFKFIGLTLIGLWVIQPVIIMFFISLNNHINYVDIFPTIGGQQIISDDLIAKLAASVTLVWNYLWYSRYVFRSDRPKDS